MAVEVYRHPNSPYWYYKIPLLNSRGHVVDYKRGSTKRRDRSEARMVARQLSNKLLNAEQLGVRDDPLLSVVIQECIDAAEAQGKPDVKNQKSFQRWLTSHWPSHLTISQLDRGLITRAQRAFLTDHSQSYVNNLTTFLISVYNQSRDVGYAVAPNQSFKGLKQKVAEKTRYLLAGEEPLLLKELDPRREIRGAAKYKDRIGTVRQQQFDDQYDLTVTLIDTGCRYSECTSMLWHCVDTQGWTGMNLYRSKVGNEGHLGLTDRLREILQRRYRQHSNSPFVFPSPFNPQRPRGYATKGIKRAIERANLNQPHLVERFGTFTPHCFRHTFASRLAQNGMSLQAISYLLGHSDTQMTQRYAHLVRKDESQRAVDILNGAHV